MLGSWFGTHSNILVWQQVAGVKSDAKSSFRGGSPSDRDVADPSSRVSPRRTLQKKERQEQEMSSYWWLSKESSEKDIVYKTNVQQGGTSRTSGSNGVEGSHCSGPIEIMSPAMKS